MGKIQEKRELHNSPLVSLVILNYNGLHFLGNLLKECFDSILKTKYENLEVIFVDNGSTDGSDVFAREFFENAAQKMNLRRLCFINNKDNVIATGYNEGIKSSKGEYIALLSNDMVYHSDSLSRIIETMEEDAHIRDRWMQAFHIRIIKYHRRSRRQSVLGWSPHHSRSPREGCGPIRSARRYGLDRRCHSCQKRSL